MGFIYQWADVIWLPVGFFIVHKPQRAWTMAFILSCMMMLRLQTELIAGGGFNTGILPFMDSDIFKRGLIFYSVIYCLYFVMAYYSPNTKGTIYMAATISIFIFALVLSSLLMVL